PDSQQQATEVAPDEDTIGALLAAPSFANCLPLNPLPEGEGTFLGGAIPAPTISPSFLGKGPGLRQGAASSAPTSCCRPTRLLCPGKKHRRRQRPALE